jgi:hypothetical protein
VLEGEAHTPPLVVMLHKGGVLLFWSHLKYFESMTADDYCEKCISMLVPCMVQDNCVSDHAGHYSTEVQ